LIHHPADLCQLPSTADLLVAGGDERLALDADSGRNRYGCRPTPDPGLIALGSSTASNISTAAYQAAGALRARYLQALRSAPELTVYRAALAELRRRLLAFCGCGVDDSPMALLAPSGTDLFMLAANLRQPQCTVLIDPAETGGGVPLALLGPRQGAAHTVAVRHADGSLRDAREVDAEYAAIVDAAAARGRQVLLVLTDVSKTGLISPGITSVLALKRRWGAQLDVLVDACQFRIDAATVRAYLAQDFMVALTGSKFMAGPTFSGALLLPRAMAANAVDAVTNKPNFGMLLRWEAALTEMERYAAVPPASRTECARRFEHAATHALGTGSTLTFEPLPVPALDRSALGASSGWDLVQTVFPFMLRAPGGRLLDGAEARRLYLLLQQATPGRKRFHLGQPVGNALRLCLSAPMIADVHAGLRTDYAADIAAALQSLSLSFAAC